MEKSMNIPKKCCLNCHFLLAQADGHTFPVNSRMREALQKKIINSDSLNDIYPRASYPCHKDHWGRIEISDLSELSKARCKKSWWTFLPYMSYSFFPHKEELDLSKAEKEADRREVKKNRLWTIAAVIIAAATLTVATLTLPVSGCRGCGVCNHAITTSE